MGAGEEVDGSRVVTMATMEGEEPSMESNSITIPDIHWNKHFQRYHMFSCNLIDKRFLQCSL